MHAHKCKKCSTVFYHSNEMRGNVEAHKCPVCGASEWDQFAPENAKLPNFGHGGSYPVLAAQASSLDRLVNVASNIVMLVMLGACVVLVGIGVYRAIKEGGV